MSTESSPEQGQRNEDNGLPYTWELDFAEFEIWPEDLDDLRGTFHNKTPELKVEHANPAGVHHSTRYEVVLDNGKRIFFYDPENTDGADLIVRNYSISRTQGSRWQVDIDLKQRTAVGFSDDPTIDFQQINEDLESAITRAFVSQVSPELLDPTEDIPANTIPTKAPEPKS